MWAWPASWLDLLLEDRTFAGLLAEVDSRHTCQYGLDLWEPEAKGIPWPLAPLHTILPPCARQACGGNCRVGA